MSSWPRRRRSPPGRRSSHLRPAASLRLCRPSAIRWGVAPFYVKRAVLDRLSPDRFGIFGVSKELPDHRFEIDATAGRYDYATLPFAEVHQLGTTLAYLEGLGLPRIEAHILGDVTVREDHVRAAVAIFNNADEVDRLLAITHRLA